MERLNLRGNIFGATLCKCSGFGQTTSPNYYYVAELYCLVVLGLSGITLFSQRFFSYFQDIPGFELGSPDLGTDDLPKSRLARFDKHFSGNWCWCSCHYIFCVTNILIQKFDNKIEPFRYMLCLNWDQAYFIFFLLLSLSKNCLFFLSFSKYCLLKDYIYF